MDVDPYALLGVTPDASPDEVTAAYRAAAKRFHPDVAGPEAAALMAQVNAAYDAIRDGDQTVRGAGVSTPVQTVGDDADRPVHVLGAWLPEETRRKLGRELLTALNENEPVRLICDVSTWASPSARLAVTDRRLLWLHDDAVTHRVRSLRFGDVAQVEQRLQWPRKRRATVKVHTTAGRKLSFADLAPATASQLAAALQR